TEGIETSALTVYAIECDDGIPDIESQLSGLSTDHPRDDPLVAWEQVPTPGDALIGNQFVWAGDYLVYLEEIDGIDRTYRAVNPATTDLGSTGSPILTEYDERGLSFPSIVGHKNDKVAVTAAPTGHFHIFVVDIPTRIDAVDITDPGFEGTGILEVTSGLFEARGDIEEDPAWDSSGNLTVATIEENAVTEKIRYDDISGTTIHPTWGDDRIACLRAGRTDPTGVHVFDVATNAVKRVSTGHETPETLSWFPDPQPVSFENSNDGNTVYGYLYTPPNASSDDDRPAIVWVHGGPSRQMRRGFHHKPAYGLFHIFNHLLIDRGYVVLEVNFRRGIGYGRDFQKSAHYDIGNSDVQDCADAATFLR
ncbi:MAG: alpha/beta hydrolase family protein, partial [Halobacteriaceae archaeon]